MDFDYDEYEASCKKIQKENDEYLDLFADTLSNLTPKTIHKHLNNVYLYINDYLLREEPLTFDYGTARISGFLGDFFIRKCMWSTPETIRSTATSIKRFYKCMLEHGKIDKDAYDYLCDEIKYGMPQWQEDCARYNDVEQDNPFCPF